MFEMYGCLSTLLEIILVNVVNFMVKIFINVITYGN